MNTLEDSYNVDVANALRLLEKVNRNEQARGWSWNVEEEYVLTPDFFSKKIYWQNDFLYVVGSSGEKYIKRGEYLYDLDNKTFTFEDSITTTLIRLVDFEDMPEAMRDFITAKACYQFQSRYLGDATLSQELAQNIADAWSRIQEYELDSNEVNIFDNSDISSMLER